MPHTITMIMGDAPRNVTAANEATAMPSCSGHFIADLKSFMHVERIRAATATLIPAKA